MEVGPRGDGTPFEPAVQMRRLPESGLLSNVLERGEAAQRAPH